MLLLILKITLIGLAALLFIAIIEHKRPLTKLMLRMAAPRLKILKSMSLSKPSPFERTDSSLWIAESENSYALKDIRPRAPHHYLIISKQRVNTMLEADPELLAEMMDLCRKVAQEAGISEDGFRVVINTNPKGLQTVYHLHMHVLGGRQLGISVG